MQEAIEAGHQAFVSDEHKGGFNRFSMRRGVPMENEPHTREAGDFKDKRILVTGGTKGIGEAIVERLIRDGGNVITTARSMPSRAKPGGFIQVDVSTREGIDQVVKATMDRLGGLDILIHNVGGSAAPGGGALALSDDDWQHAFDMNLFAAVRLDRAFLPLMLKQGSGVIIHISSIQRTLPIFEATLAYAAAKAALTNYSAWGYAALALVLSLLIGLLAGVLPALRAASLQPLEALRAE
jgi:enoyl-[acyl-carrier-protein] reductase (NADH)